ncbi:MAG: WG repeat-containing protein, partial [Thermoflexibacteraceae bacterium]
MNRKIVICLSMLYVLIYGTQLYAQAQLIPYHKNKLWGYCNAQKQIIIPPQYYFADKFTNGRAWVQNAQKKWAMIDGTGKQLTQFTYTGYSLFNDTLFKVQIYFPNKKTPHHYEKYHTNLVNLKGEEQLAWQYRLVEEAGNGWWKVERCYFKDSTEREHLKNYTLLINPQNKTERLFPIIDKFNDNIAKYKYKCKYVDTTGKIVLNFTNQFYFCYDFNEKRAKVRFNNKEEGFINTHGQVITKKRYEVITHDSQFKEGLAVVKYEKKYGYIDRNGNEVIAPQYEEAASFSEGLALVGNGALYGMINKHNQLIVPFLYNDIQSFHNGFAIFTKNGLKGVINKQGKEIVPAQYDEIDNFEGGMAAVYFNNTVGFIDTTGRLVIPIQYFGKDSWL